MTWLSDSLARCGCFRVLRFAVFGSRKGVEESPTSARYRWLIKRHIKNHHPEQHRHLTDTYPPYAGIQRVDAVHEKLLELEASKQTDY